MVFNYEPSPINHQRNMARILCLDYGAKRTGIAVTDPMQIIATALITIETKTLMLFLKDYFAKELVELILIGMPLNLDDTKNRSGICGP